MCLLPLLVAACRLAQAPSIDDRRLSDPAFNIRDPEYDPVSKQVAFVGGGQLWVAALDPRTGVLHDPTGRQIWVDSMVVTHAGHGAVGNGPEWGHSAEGAALHYTRRIGGVPSLATAWPTASGGWRSVGHGSGRFLPMPAIAPTSPEPRVAYLTLQEGALSLGWTPGDGAGAAIDSITPVVSQGPPRWVGDRRQLTFVALDRDGQPQAMFLDLESGHPEVLSHNQDEDTVVHDVWALPLPGGGTLAWYTQTSHHRGELVHDALHVLERAEAGWVERHVLRPDVPLGALRPYLQSPEPFWAQGRPFVALLTTGSVLPHAAPADVWIVDLLEPSPQGSRRITSDEVRIRREPEPVVIGDEVFVYYTDIVDGNATIWRAATGLAATP